VTEEFAAEENAARLAERLGITFHNLDTLRLALTHRSVVQDLANSTPDRDLTPQERLSNERLEFLGDSILGWIVADYLYKADPYAPEGALTARRASLVRAEQLVRWAREIGLGDYLFLGQGEKVTEGARDRMLAGGFEALIGAIAVDRGLREAKRFLRRYIERDVDEALADEQLANAKGALQEHAQEKFKVAPDYHLVSAEGPAHARTFVVEARIAGTTYGVGEGGSKRVAEQAAARAALAALDAPNSTAASRAERPRRQRRKRDVKE
jgi:ribonuclease-3